MNRALFFDRIRQSLYNGKMTEAQVRGMSAVLSAWEGAPTRNVAYGLATALGETGPNMQPVREGFKSTDKAARAYVAKHYGSTYGKPAGPFGHVYYGRGYVQLTWLRNYLKAGTALGIDLARDPDRALEPELAAMIMRNGMEQGWFTGKKLSNYLTTSKTDYKNARRIINGTDRAAEIAGYAMAFESALRAASYGSPERPVQTEEPIPATPVASEPVQPQPDDAKPKNTPISPASRTAQGTVTAGASGLVVAGSAATEMASKLQEANTQISGGTWLLIAAGILTMVGAAYAFYARWRDGGGLFPWERK